MGDILVTYGDFKKSNTPLLPSSYVEEYWEAQARAAGCTELPTTPPFKEALALSRQYKIPMHPLYTYDYSDVSSDDMLELRNRIASGKVRSRGAAAFRAEEDRDREDGVRQGHDPVVERLCLPHRETDAAIIIEGDDAQSIVSQPRAGRTARR